MKRECIAKGKTIDDAIAQAAIELGVDKDDLSVEVLDYPSKGFLGIGATPARIKATAGEDEPEEKSVDDGFTTAPGEKRHGRKQQGNDNKTPETKKEPSKKQKENQRKPRESSQQKEKPETVEQVNVPEITHKPGMEEQEKKAAEFVEGFIKTLGIKDYNVTTASEENTVKIFLTGKDMGTLIGKRGDAMYALQYLTSLVLNKGGENSFRVEFDVENYRAKRTAFLERLAVKTAERVVKTRRNIALEYMQSYERRVIHSTLQNYDKVTTRSVGVEPQRKVIVQYTPNK